MPVQASTLGVELVVDSDLDPVSPVCFDCWTGEATVDEDTLLFDTVGLDCASGDCEVVKSRHASRGSVRVVVRVL